MAADNKWPVGASHSAGEHSHWAPAACVRGPTMGSVCSRTRQVVTKSNRYRSGLNNAARATRLVEASAACGSMAPSESRESVFSQSCCLKCWPRLLADAARSYCVCFLSDASICLRLTALARPSHPPFRATVAGAQLFHPCTHSRTNPIRTSRFSIQQMPNR